jgi:hypothetical protein
MGRISGSSAGAALLVLFAPLAAPQGGPPFLSDDPDTPGPGHWEINMGFLGSRNPYIGLYQIPDLDINYGLGVRIQLKYELPLAMAEDRGTPSHLNAGLGNSLLGVKYRFYEHPRSEQPMDPESESDPKFGFSTYPQLVLNNPTRSVARGIVDPGPQFYLPVEGNAHIGPIRFSAETGYWFGNKDIAPSWTRGVVAGHEFRRDTELYMELYSQTDTGTVAGVPKLSWSTLGIGGRLPLTKGHSIRLLGMFGRGFATVSPVNQQPSWIGYAGLQFLSEGRRRHSHPQDPNLVP